jgi:hypothetical protein
LEFWEVDHHREQQQQKSLLEVEEVEELKSMVHRTERTSQRIDLSRMVAMIHVHPQMEDTAEEV